MTMKANIAPVNSNSVRSISPEPIRHKTIHNMTNMAIAMIANLVFRLILNYFLGVRLNDIIHHSRSNRIKVNLAIAKNYH